MYKENVELLDWCGSRFVVNKETRGCRFGNDLAYFRCANCKNQSICDESGTVFDCNNYISIEEEEFTRTGKYKLYCLNYERETENETNANK